ncbi:MAG TPA: DUF547 domain-containing protein [Candidatus Krumholzibacteria bacterium]|nr:DUF547 domain-containing protein [Candidatus Krumholzibacteria bacterium]
MIANPRIVLVIPALDEEEALPLVLADLVRAQRSTSTPLFDELLVVDNGSRDGTAAIARRAGATVLHEPRRGYGAACLRALAYLHERAPEIVVFMDADRSDDTQDLPALLRPLLDGTHDLVIGARAHGRSERGALLPQARFGNWLATRLIHARFGFRYTDLGPFRAVRHRTLEAMHLEDHDFGWTVEMQIRALQMGARVIEVPVRYRRRIGRSKISGTISGSIRAGTKILATLWRLRGREAAGMIALVALGLGSQAAPANLVPANSAPANSAPANSAPANSPTATVAPTPAFDHAEWDRILRDHVDSQGRVAYRDLQQREEAVERSAGDARPASLRGYLQRLAGAEPDAWTRDEQLAFWINAYNAGMVSAILSGETPEPVLARGKLFKFWKFEVADKQRTLDEIEHEILRGRFHEPRIHFALVCASTSCPKLRRESYRAPILAAQLDAQAREFINDPQRNVFLPAENKMRLSKIFDWFGEDFTTGGSLRAYLASYAVEPRIQAWLRSDVPIEITHLEYDWTLNAQPHQRPAPTEP